MQTHSTQALAVDSPRVGTKVFYNRVQKLSYQYLRTESCVYLQIVIFIEISVCALLLVDFNRIRALARLCVIA